MLGLKLETTRGEILKGLIEATTFYLRECLESLPATGIEIDDFRAVGGGSKSEAWLQICGRCDGAARGAAADQRGGCAWARRLSRVPGAAYFHRWKTASRRW